MSESNIYDDIRLANANFEKKRNPYNENHERRIVEFSQKLFSQIKDPNSDIYKKIINNSSQGYRNVCITAENPPTTIPNPSYEEEESTSTKINNLRPKEMSNLRFDLKCDRAGCIIDVKWGLGRKDQNCYLRT